MTKILKYRPVLTGKQILHILNLCKNESPISDESAKVIGVLAPFQAKIDNSAIVPAYETTVKQSLLESLGGVAPGSSFPVPSKEQIWEAAYNKWLENPADCTLKELEYVDEHRYLNDLMESDEIEKFEGRNKL